MFLEQSSNARDRVMNRFVSLTFSEIVSDASSSFPLGENQQSQVVSVFVIFFFLIWWRFCSRQDEFCTYCASNPSLIIAVTSWRNHRCEWSNSRRLLTNFNRTSSRFRTVEKSIRIEVGRFFPSNDRKQQNELLTGRRLCGHYHDIPLTRQKRNQGLGTHLGMKHALAKSSLHQCIAVEVRTIIQEEKRTRMGQLFAGWFPPWPREVNPL